MKYAFITFILITSLFCSNAYSNTSDTPSVKNELTENNTKTLTFTEKAKELYKKLAEWNDSLRPEWSKKLFQTTNFTSEQTVNKTENSSSSGASTIEAPKLSYKERALKFYYTLKKWNDSLRPQWVTAFFNKNSKTKEITPENINKGEEQTQEETINLASAPKIDLPNIEQKIEIASHDPLSQKEIVAAPAEIITNSEIKIEKSENLTQEKKSEEADIKEQTQKSTDSHKVTDKQEQIALAPTNNQIAPQEKNHKEKIQEHNKEKLLEKHEATQQKIQEPKNPEPKKIVIVGLEKVEPKIQLSQEEVEKAAIEQQELEKFIENEVAMLTLPQDDDVVLGELTHSAKLTYADDAVYLSAFWKSYNKEKNYKKHVEMLNIISTLEHGKNDIKNIDLAEDYAIEYIRKNDISGLRTILNHSDINLAKDQSLIFHAIQSGSYDATYYLLKRGGLANNKNIASLQYLAEKENRESLIWLLQKTIEPNANIYSKSE